jgi:hypothetical protein
LTLNWYPNLNAAPGQAEKLLRIRKDWTTNPYDHQIISKQIPFFPMTIVCIEEEVT